MLETLYFMIEGDVENRYKILDDISDTVWSLLFIWFGLSPHHEIYKRIFVEILFKLFKYGRDYVMMNVLIKVAGLS